MVHAMSDDKSLGTEAERAIARVRRLMLIASLTTVIAIGSVLGVIGYRVSTMEGSAGPPPDVTAMLPAGAKVISTSASNDHIVVTIEIAGVIEIRTFDPDTLKPLGRLRLETKP
jgi:hypothetical protein